MDISGSLVSGRMVLIIKQFSCGRCLVVKEQQIEVVWNHPYSLDSLLLMIIADRHQTERPLTRAEQIIVHNLSFIPRTISDRNLYVQSTNLTSFALWRCHQHGLYAVQIVTNCTHSSDKPK